jgi:hypothetical protein
MRSNIVLSGLRSLLRLPVIAARRIREQADKEEHAWLIARFALLEHSQPRAIHGLMWMRPARRAPQAGQDDPLELLWNLPARRPESAR